jgi:hypothetical protein
MGKRSCFERREADSYPTPRAAVVPLIPYLRGVRCFAEPCAGNGDLVRHLESFGLRCGYQGDIRTGQDALAIDSYGAIDAIITNPPYTRDLMHKLSHISRRSRKPGRFWNPIGRRPSNQHRSCLRALTS